MGSSYYINNQDEFIIEDYNQKKPFSSFLPAVAGLYGKPMWAYYVNRGQCMATFGVNNKDYSIMEFQPANKAYRQTTLQGFRTFLKVKKADGTVALYEPFRDMQADKEQKVKQRMIITSYDFKLEDINETLGIKTQVMFCTLPGEEIPALMRQTKIENISKENISIEVLDGLPVIIPYYLINHDMKNECNLRQAWMSADMEDGLPFYRIKALPYDTAETVLLEGGNFYINFNFQDDEMKISQIITDPVLIFGNVTDLTYPAAFASLDFTVPEEQVSAGYTPCGFGYKKISLKPHESDVTDTLVGSAPSLSRYKRFLKEKVTTGYIQSKLEENKKLIERTKRHSFTSSSSKQFDLYMGQTFLDNYLRGGYPIHIGNGKHIFYVYSRKHGDLEREYNLFQVDSTYYSQGNSNFRDVNQNRRNDVYFFPFTKNSSIKTFFNLIQLDGYNPLVLNGSRFEAKDIAKCKEITEEYFGKEDAEGIVKMLEKSFTPGSLLMGIEQMNVVVKKESIDAYLNTLLENCIKEDYATFKEGYWTDHWTYNTDLLEQFMQVYPDKITEVMFNDLDYTYYDNDEMVVPRNKRYVLTDAGVRQYGAVQKIPGKPELIGSRTFRPNQVRTKKGTGDIYKCTLASKILVLLTNKVATLDYNGIGLEMEGGKPGWCDALNGMPGIIGSSINESAEVRRMAFIMKMISGYADQNTVIKVPIEAKEFYDKIYNLLENGVSDFEYWNESNYIKEAYRELVKLGIDGEEADISIIDAQRYMDAIIQFIDKGIAKAYNKETGVYDTYFINEAVKYEILKDADGKDLLNEKGLPLVNVSAFKARAIPPFLEGQVHMMRAKPSLSKELHKAVKHSGMYDEKLDMFKINANVMDETKEIGRQNVFPRGWLENEGVFLHMEYKYFLELLRSGLYDEFSHYLKTAVVPFLNASVYGRSILENSSFIASSAHPDERVHGGGYVSRLTGASAEMLHIWRIMTVGQTPFVLDDNNNLSMKLKPQIPGWLFTEEEKEVYIYTENGEKTFIQPANSFAFNFLGDILTVYHNEQRLDTYSEEAKITKISLYSDGQLAETIDNGIVLEPYASKIREGAYDRIEAVISK